MSDIDIEWSIKARQALAESLIANKEKHGRWGLSDEQKAKIPKQVEVFPDYEAFCLRSDPSMNGISPELAEQCPWLLRNPTSNAGCWNCVACDQCVNCYECTGCSRCYDCFGLHDEGNRAMLTADQLEDLSDE